MTVYSTIQTVTKTLKQLSNNVIVRRI